MQTMTGPWPAYAPRSAWRALLHWQTRLARRFDRLLSEEFRIDGNRDFMDHLVPEYLRPGKLIYDVGGGKNPILSGERKSELRLRIIGLDIDAEELAAAPEGCYDDTVCCDISRFRGKGEADLVICQSLLEHVLDTNGALAAIASILKPGGRALIFVPSRNAVYARLNLVLPQRLKRRIMHGIFPEMSRDHGFPAYYNGCTPSRLERMAQAQGLVRERRRLYFHSTYFSFCFPLHALWRLWLLFFRFLAGVEAAETFSVVFRKPVSGQFL
ncbi:MAG TPA: methyltransferase domain-containing protein [Bryobacteraceae bacterium]|nr:methyltransferase domain-containing protein [Bryobacteraceae bacterium]